MDTEKHNNSLLVGGLELKEILDKELDVIGFSGLDALYYEMNNHGFEFEKERTYTIAQIESFFRMMFGEEACRIILNRIKKALIDKSSHKTGQ